MIRDAYKESWKHLSGSKGALWMIAAPILLLIITIGLATNFIVTESLSLHYFLGYLVMPGILYLLIGPFFAASVLVAVKHYQKYPINLFTGFKLIGRYVATAFAFLIIGLLANSVSIILNIPAVSYSLAGALPYFDVLAGLLTVLIFSLLMLSLPLLLDKNIGVFEALKQSFQKIAPHWLSVFVLFFSVYFSLFILYLPLTLGLLLNIYWLLIVGLIFFVACLIWLYPMIFLMAGYLYKKCLV